MNILNGRIDSDTIEKKPECYRDGKNEGRKKKPGQQTITDTHISAANPSRHHRWSVPVW